MTDNRFSRFPAAAVIAVALAVCVTLAPPLRGADLPVLDFRLAAECSGWQAAHDLAQLQSTPAGLRAEITGPDPYFHGPPLDLPEGAPLWLRLRLKSDQGGSGQLFYFRQTPTEADSVRFSVPAGAWQEVRLRLPALGHGWRLRIDPPGQGGGCVFESLRFETRVLAQSPAWPQPTRPGLGSDPVRLESGVVRLEQSRRSLDEFEVQVAGQLMACGNNAALMGYARNGQPRWVPFGRGTNATVTVQHSLRTQVADAQLGGTLTVEASFTDPDEGRWVVTRTFAPAPEGTISVLTRVVVDRDREVLHLPMFTLLPGLGSFGTNKAQALFAGVEYLENEPSSSTADLNAPASNRQVPDTLKLTLPLMVISAADRYIGLTWKRDQAAALGAVFDSPDRLLGSGAQLMGLLLPGSDGSNREESDLIPYESLRFTANRSVTAGALILGGMGGTVVPAVQQYVRLAGLPPLAAMRSNPADYSKLAARGWLDSEIRDGSRYRHAAPGFPAMPAADAAVSMKWLAEHVSEPRLADRLLQAATEALDRVPVAQRDTAQIGHVRLPLPALIFGGVLENVAQAREQAEGLLRRFQPDGTVLFHPRADGLDYSRTHWERHANGLTAQVVASLLETAAFAGDQALIDRALDQLQRLADRYHDTVPRGAQTWEMPLHTPDILAAAYLVRAFTLGYELTGQTGFLDQARYWAWTGVPFVYLATPTAGRVGPYATIAVLGATSWVAPNWIGLPVQWCGLVYADALHRLAPHDPGAPWQQVADGIALSGIQQGYPEVDTQFQGLLPDSFSLQTQTRNGPAINPATVWVPAVRALGQTPLYEFRVAHSCGMLIHAPGAISEWKDSKDMLEFHVRPWTSTPAYLLINRASRTPEVSINAKPVALAAAGVFDARSGNLVLPITGESRVRLRWPAAR